MSSISKTVQSFYNQTPFPDYELHRFNSKEDLKAAAGGFAKLLDRSIPENASVIDVGTGTGQLAAFLSLRRNVTGIDFSESSLNKAMALKGKLGLHSLQLKNIDILNQTELEKLSTFDYVLCLGVLHHTEDARATFKNIVRLLNPGGYIAVGLYNKYSRIPLQIRRALIKTIYKNNEKIKEKYLCKYIGDLSDREKARGWWADQFEHPHETAHTIGEVLRWFKENKMLFCRALPDKLTEMENLWDKKMYLYWPIRMYKQLTWLWKTGNEGGYWITFGQQFS